MAVAISLIPASRGGNLPGLIVANGSVADEQNTGEVINVDFAGVPPHRYRLLSAILTTQTIATALTDHASNWGNLMTLFAGSSGELVERAPSEPALFYWEDTFPDSTVTSWMIRWRLPFFQHIHQELADTLRINSRTADLNASPTGVFSFECVLAIDDA